MWLQAFVNGKILMENRELKTVDMERVAYGVGKAIEKMGIAARTE